MNQSALESSHVASVELHTIIETQRQEIHRLKSIINNLPGSIYWKDRNGVYLGRNTYSHEKSKSINIEDSSSELDSPIGKTDYDYLPKEIADAYRKNDIEVMENGKELVSEETVITHSGEKLIQLSTKKPLYDENGNIAGVVGNTVDITYLKTIERELAAKEKLEKVNNIKTEFIRNMEHDIRTPFNGIWSITQHLWETEEHEERKELLEDVTNCAKELLDYCNYILDFSKIEQGNIICIEKKFDLKKIVNSIMDIERPAAKIKNLNFTLEYDNDLPVTLIGDPYRVQRILINLVSNAIKFTHQGYVKLCVLLAQKEKNNKIIVKFIIEDTGIGIPDNQQDYIYEKFTRIIPSNKGIYKGMGLGLSVVKQFIQEMDGEIELKSELGKGSAFICILSFKIPLINIS